MKKIFAAALMLSLPIAATAQLTPTLGKSVNADARVQNDSGVVLHDATGAQVGTPSNPLNTTGGGGGAVTCGGAACSTAAKQDTGNTSAAQIAAANGNPTDAKSTVTDTTAASEIALLKGQIDRLQALVSAMGSPFQAGGSIGNTVFGSTQSGLWNVSLLSGTNIAGKFGIDQTTPGTSNGIVQTPTTVAAAGIVPSPGGAATGGVNFKTGAGNVYGFQATSAGTAGYVILVDTTSGADGAVVPLRCYTLAANSSLELNWRDAPLRFTNGLFGFFSTTGCFTKTQSNTAYLVADVK